MNENLEKIENYIELAEKIDSVVYSNQFFPMVQLKNLKSNNLKFSLKGLNEEAEKKLLAVYQKDFIYNYLSLSFFK